MSPKRRKPEDRGRDHSIEVDITLDVLEHLETQVADILCIVQEMKEGKPVE